MQWRLGLAGLVNYFGSSLFTPALFMFFGAVAAGQMGMTLQITGGLQAAALAWVSTKASRFGMLVAKRHYAELDRLWWESVWASVGIMVVGSVVLWSAIFALNVGGYPIAQRLLSPLPTALLLFAAILMQVSQCQTAYILAHRRAPFVAQAIISSLATGALTLFLGRSFGALGVATGNLLVVGLFVIPYETFLWVRCRAERNLESAHAS